MATYTQQCSKVGSFSYATNFTLYVVLTNRDGNSSTNKSIVDFNVYCQSSGSGSIDSKHALYFALNGTAYRNETVQVKVSSPNAYISIASGSIEVTHNSDGTKTIPFSASIRANSYGVSASLNGNFTLTTIPRFANLTSLSVASRTINSVTFNYTTDRTARLFCSIDGGTTWLNNGNPFVDNTTSGSFTVYYEDRQNTTRLSPNTPYSFYVLCRATDSGLDTGKFISSATYDYAKIISAPDFTDEGNPTINYSNPFGNNVTALKACISLTGAKDDIVYRDISKTGTSYTFNLTDAERNVLRKAAITNSLKVIFFIKTEYRSTYYSTVEKTMSIINANPTFSNFTYKDVNSSIVDNLTGNNQTIVKGYSMVQATVSTANKAVAKKGATMSKYRLSIGEKTDDASYSSSSDVSMRIDYVNNNVFTVYAIDSRQNSSFKQIAASKYIPYEPIVIKQIQAVRTNSVTSQTTLTFSGSMWAGSFGLKPNDIIACSYRYKKTTSNTWINGTTNLAPVRDGNGSGSNFSLSVVIAGDLGANGFDIDNSYNIQVLIEDRLSNNYSNPAAFILGPGTPAMAIYKNNVAIGQRYDTGDGSKLQVNGTVKAQTFKGNATSATSLNGGNLRSSRSFLFTLNATTASGRFYKLAKIPATADNNAIQLNIRGSLGNWTEGKATIDLQISNRNTFQVFGNFYGRAEALEAQRIVIYQETDGSHSVYLYNATPFTGPNTLEITWGGFDIYPTIYTDYSYTTTPTGTNVFSSTVNAIGRLLRQSVLYENSSGTNGTVTLSESAANFSYLEIYYNINGTRYLHTKIFNPNGKLALLSGTWANDAGIIQIETRDYLISGTSITPKIDEWYANLTIDGVSSFGKQVRVTINKVVGYR